MESEMTPQQADYCDKLSSGNIEVAVPCESSMSLRDLRVYGIELLVAGLPKIKARDHNLAYTETTIIVNDILTGLGK
jgi:hypothetical protein